MIKRDAGFLLFSDIYLKFSEPKARRKAFAIVEATLSCIGRKGFLDVSVQMVARESGVSRTLIHYYFRDLAELKDIAIKYVRYLFQKLVVDAMSAGACADEKLRLYIHACFRWVSDFKNHAAVWFRFLNACQIDKKLRALNTAAVAVGQARIETILEQGREDGIFKFTDASITSKSIQIIITGALITVVSEDLADISVMVQDVQTQVLNCARGSFALEKHEPSRCRDLPQRLC